MTSIDPTAGDSGLKFSGEELSVAEVARALAASEVDSGEGAAADGAAEAAPDALVPRLPPSAPLRRNRLSGRYRSRAAGVQLELRVDIDGSHPLNIVSGDFFQMSGATTTYIGSFTVDAPTLSVAPGQVTVAGTGRFTFAAGAPNVRVTIPRTTILQPHGPATVQFSRPNNQPGAQYVCAYASAYFRTVRYEQDRVSDVATPSFQSYDTGSLPSGGPARTLSVLSAYAEAGIEFLPTAGADIVPPAEEGVDRKWSDAELHASMQAHFSLWQDQPLWQVWEVVCQLHELGSGLLGIMFDQKGKQRQGCAVFHAGMGGTQPQELRTQLYCYVHELGHCFNLLHSWQKSLGTPPDVDRPDARSYMNYPWRYPNGGDTGFWRDFGFAFDDPELAHLRHGFRNDVIMGGSAFAVGSSLEEAGAAFADPIEDRSGLALEIDVHKPFLFGEPVVLNLRLRATDTRGKATHGWLHPNMGMVKIGIRKPSGQVLVYQPPIEHCVGPNERLVTPDAPIEDSAFIGYGKGGFYFDQPGTYLVRAIYYASDGSQVYSNAKHVRVRHPVTAEDEQVADLMFGDEQGMLLYLKGSDSEALRRGNEKLETIRTEHKEHPLAQYARMIQGLNAGRSFKVIRPDRRIHVRQPDYTTQVALLQPVGMTKPDTLIDHVTHDMVRQAITHAAGKEEAAKIRTGRGAAAKAEGGRR